MFAPFLHVSQTAYDKQGPCNVYRWQPGGEDEGAHTVYEIFPYYLFAYNVGADRCSRFTECTDKEVNVVNAMELFGTTESLPAAYTEGV